MEYTNTCQAICECVDPTIGNTYYECNYGSCCGLKCQCCDAWLFEQGAFCCYPNNKNSPEGRRILSQQYTEEFTKEQAIAKAEGE